jgi:hypothetical protein
MRCFTAVLLSLLALNLALTAAERLRFWNLTARNHRWGPDQRRNHPDGAVDADERLTFGTGYSDTEIAAVAKYVTGRSFDGVRLHTPEGPVFMPTLLHGSVGLGSWAG